MAGCDIDNINVRAFLKLLGYAENFPRDDDQVYYRLFGGGTFTDITKHPNKRITIGKYTSTAAGAYQILYSTWFEAKRDGVAFDFSPASQDKIAFSKLRFRGALQYVCDANLPQAVRQLTLEWVSLPGGSQPRLSLEAAVRQFQTYVIEFTK